MAQPVRLRVGIDKTRSEQKESALGGIATTPVAAYPYRARGFFRADIFCLALFAEARSGDLMPPPLVPFLKRALDRVASAQLTSPVSMASASNTTSHSADIVPTFVAASRMRAAISRIPSSVTSLPLGANPVIRVLPTRSVRHRCMASSQDHYYLSRHGY